MKKTLLTLLALGPGAALAHPGHEAAITEGAGHWLTQGDHIAVVLATGLLFWAALLPIGLRAARRRRDAEKTQAPRRALGEQ